MSSISPHIALATIDPQPASLALSPHGRVHLEPGSPSDAGLEPRAFAAIHTAFNRGSCDGLLHLGAVEADSILPPTLTFWRDFAKHFISRSCALIASGEATDPESVSPPPDLLDELVAGAPPMVGAEYLSVDVLAALWRDLGSTLAREAAARKLSVHDFLASLNPAWRLVGHVCFHLAELRDNKVTPFAFLATYVGEPSRGGRARHVRLGDAVERSGKARDNSALLTLLAPVERAAEGSPFIKGLVDSSAIFETTAWTASEAYDFLRAVPAIEASGITVRIPDWWKPTHPPRVSVRVSVGGDAPGTLGADALLGFSVELALDGEKISPADWKAIRQGTAGLALVKGRWVEVDRAKLDEVLHNWRAVERATDGSISFSDGMRLLSGAALGGGVAEDMTEDVAEWTSVTAGPWLKDLLRRLRSPELSGKSALRKKGFTAELRPYQETGVQWLSLLRGLELGGCLADDMGLGKTIQMLALWCDIKARSPRAVHLLVVPASLLGNWQAEAARFAPRLRLLVAHPSAMTRAELDALEPSVLEDVDVVITTYGYVQRLAWLTEVKWDTVVLDEAQAIRNPGTRQARAVKSMRARTRFALTGTPIENRIGDLWSLFDFIRPGLLGSSARFKSFVKQLRNGDGAADYGPLRALVQPYILRRLKTDKRVISDLPDKTEVRAFCTLTRKQAALYQTAVDALARKLKDTEGIERRGLILAFLIRFKQICNHPAHWLGDGTFDPAASGKFIRLKELCETIASRQEKVLVFTQFREITEPLSNFLGEVFGQPGLVLHGATSPRRRSAMVESFQRDDGPPYFVLSLKAGGTGLNLTAASHVVHFDRWWNPAVENQATDRAYRIGQHRNVLVHKFVCRGTVEEKIDDLIESKLALARDVLDGGGETLITELGDEEIISLVTLDIDAATQERT
jgi:non-specific serine/threonine protein kinase